MGEIQLNTSFIFWAFILHLFRPSISIDDSAAVERPWGTERIPLAAGQHKITVWFKYLFIAQAGKGEIVVDVPEGGMLQVSYRAPWIVFFAGKMKVAGPFAIPPAAAVAQPQQVQPHAQPAPAAAPAPAAQAAVAPAWLQDPTGRHELRWYDGTTWTANVSDHGVTATDPV